MDVAKQNQSCPQKQQSILIERKYVRYRPENHSQKAVEKKDYLNAMMPDQYIKNKALSEAVKKHNDSTANKIENGMILLGVPVAASIATGATTAAQTVAEKVKNTLTEGKKWGVALTGAIGGYQLINSAANNISGLKEFKENHQGLTTTGSFVGAVATGYAANSVVDSLTNKIAGSSINKQTIGISMQKFATGLGESLNKSKTGELLNNKIFKPTEKFLKETRPGKFIDNFGAFLLLGGLALKFINDNDKINKDSKKIKQNLENQRRESIQKIVANPFSQAPVQAVKSEESSKIFILPAEAKQALADS
ncbi:MAG TPA: hypothetical protein P5556_02195 [Candidatus Gastranaerophilales bacterium]|nr:hypothetical protein [Candidatus Gastranaerophilales bacterium]